MRLRNCIAFSLLILASPLRAIPVDPIIEERHHLFILSTLAYLHAQATIQPKSGHDIAAIIAWDVENVDLTPQFVIDKNRNFEKQGNIFHAEIMAIEKAVAKQFDPSKSSERQNARGLIGTTLYSSLEPCPFCMTAITISRIPNVMYFMEDPGLRDCQTHDLLFPFPDEFLGRKIPKASPSSLLFAENVNLEVRAVHSGKYKDSQPALDFRLYFQEQASGFLAVGSELFRSYKVLHEQNRELYEELADAIIHSLSETKVLETQSCEFFSHYIGG
jgi:tRNA(Arg) A34 adenosine deaminase TadA